MAAHFVLVEKCAFYAHFNIDYVRRENVSIIVY
jgi:hypothetical protein